MRARASVVLAALVLAGCHEAEEPATPVSAADRAAVRTAVTDVLDALVAGSPQRFCASLTRASREDLARRDDGGTCVRYVEANRDELLDTDVRTDDVRKAVASLEIEVEGRFAIARTPENDFPLRREGAAWKLDLLAIDAER